MFLLLIPLSAAAISLLYAGYWAQRIVRFKLDEAALEDASDKAKKAVKKYLVGSYRALGIVFVVFLITFLAIPSLRGVVFGFVAGFVFAILVGYFSFLFLTRLSAYITVRSSHGIIDAFQNALGGGNVLGIFSTALVLLLTTLYSLFTPTASGFVGLILGAALVALYFRFISSVYVQTASVGRAIIDAMGVVLTVFSVALSALSVSIMVSVTVFPGLFNAILLPMLVVATGIISSAVGIKLVRLSSTTNIFKNLLLVIMGVIVISAVTLFPVILWALGEDTPYSPASIWIAGVLGFLFAAGVLALYFLNIFQRFNAKEIASIFALIISLGIGMPYILSGIYGVTIFVLAFVSVISAMLTLHLFGSVVDSAYNLAQAAELGEERKNIAVKLSSISHITREGVNIYIWAAAALVSLLLFVFFQQEAAAKLDEEDFVLNNPIILAGIFFGGGLGYWLTSNILSAVKNNISGRVNSLLFWIALIPAVLGPVLGFNFLGSLLVGATFIGAFLALKIILEENIVPGTLGLKELKNTSEMEKEMGNYYKKTSSVTLVVMIQMLIIIALVWVIV
jgi:K(+)-stimulated pyrophosphate-energized sodium pump